jgi:hypothetical protein
MKLSISEDRIRGRRLVLTNGALAVEKVEPLPPEQAHLTDTTAHPFHWHSRYLSRRFRFSTGV